MARESRRYLIDGSMARGGGGFTYLVNVIPQLARLAPEARFKVVVSDRKVADAIPTADNVELEFLGDLGLKDRLKYTYRGAARLAREWGADVYFSAGEQAPLDAPCPTVTAFRNPNVFTFGKGQGLTFRQRARLLALHVLARISARFADRVMFVSLDSAAWIGDSIGLEARKRVVIHHGIDPEPWSPESGSNLHDRPYILSVSSIYPYKNFVRLIDAYAELAERHPDVPDLVIIGDDQDPAYSEKMRAAKEAAGDASPYIHILGEVPYDEIRQYYKNAALFVFPSHLETFGHPLLEAMASEVPLVAADIPVFREIAGDAAFYADPFKPSDIAAAMEAALYEPDAAETLVKRGRARLRHFTWRRSAERLLALFHSLLVEREEARQPARAMGFPLTASRPSPLQAPGAAARVMRSH